MIAIQSALQQFYTRFSHSILYQPLLQLQL